MLKKIKKSISNFIEMLTDEEEDEFVFDFPECPEKELSVEETKRLLDYCGSEGFYCNKCSLYIPSDEECRCTRKLKLSALNIINNYEERIKGLEADVERARREGVRTFAHFCIDKSKNGVIKIDEIPDLIIKIMERKNEKHII